MFWSMFYNDSNTFFATLFNAFVIIEWFDLNSSLKIVQNGLNSSSKIVFF